MKAKAAVFMGAHKDFDVREFDVVKAPSGYAAMEIIASGICGTDIHMHNGKLRVPYPSIIGHEFVGRIIDVDEKEAEKYGLSKGDAVIADIAVPCGKCKLCESGDDANCVNMAVTNGTSIDEMPYLYGGYTQVNFTPLTNLIKLPKNVDPSAAAVFACPGPTAIHAFSLAAKAGVDLSKIDCAVVQGFGPVGAFATMYLKKLGVKKVYVIIAGANEKRDEMAKKFGADKVFSLSKDGAENVIKALQSENGGIGVDLCFEASGAPQAFIQGIDILRNRGVYLVPGQYSASGTVELSPQLITFKALHIIGSSQYSVCDVEKYVEFMSKNEDVFPMVREISSYYPIEKINEAVADAKSGKNIKTLLVR